jgi:hypothetical protein
MYQLERAIIRPKTDRSSGTFRDCALYGITYSLQFYEGRSESKERFAIQRY